MAVCYICDRYIGWFAEKNSYVDKNDNRITLCKECNEETNIKDKDKGATINKFKVKLNYFIEKKDNENAKVYCKKILVMLDHNDFDALKTLAIIYCNKSRDYNEKEDRKTKERTEEIVIGYLKNLMKSYPNKVETWKASGEIFHELGYPEQAANCAYELSQLQAEEPGEDPPEGFEPRVKRKCTIKTAKPGLSVQSNGERLIANFLFSHKIGFEYDKQITLKGNEKKDGYFERWIRPDFYLTELTLVIEYWGLEGTPDYDEKMQDKKRRYIESNTKYISIGPEDLSSLDNTLKVKLERLGCKFPEIINKPEEGYCIRCKNRIKLDTKKPYCLKDYELYKSSGFDKYHLERVCHMCGKTNRSTLNKPVCMTCFKNK